MLIHPSDDIDPGFVRDKDGTVLFEVRLRWWFAIYNWVPICCQKLLPPKAIRYLYERMFKYREPRGRWQNIRMHLPLPGEP